MLAKSAEILHGINVCYLETFFAGLEESQWNYFADAFCTMDMFLLRGSLGLATKSIKKEVKNHDMLDGLAAKITGRNSPSVFPGLKNDPAGTHEVIGFDQKIWEDTGDEAQGHQSLPVTCSCHPSHCQNGVFSL